MTKNSEIGIHFYMVECDNKGRVLGEEKDIEASFNGLTYMKADGLNALGKPKIYKEQFADSDRVRVYKPETTTREATKVKFSFVIVGDNRYATYDAFAEYVSDNFIRYHDTARNKYLYFYVDSEIKPAKEMFYGSQPYLTLDLEVQNIFGQTFDEPIN